MGSFAHITKSNAVVGTARFHWREDFAGTALNPANWHPPVVGPGQTVTVANSELQIGAGTTANSETVIVGVPAFSVPFRLGFMVRISQRIVNQEILLEVVNASGDMWARYLFDGTAGTVTKVNVANAGFVGSEGTPSTPSSASSLWCAIEMLGDEVYFHIRGADSTAGINNTVTRNRLIPDPNQLYFVRIRVRNLAVAPASNTALIVENVTLQDMTVLSTEATGARGAIVTSQAQAVQVTSGLIVSSVQSVNAAFADTATPLAPSAVFTGTARDLGSLQRSNRFGVASTADVAGTLFVEQSNDATNWLMTHRADTVALADSGAVTRHVAVIDAAAVNRHVRALYRNGATSQGSFRLVSMQVGV